MWTSIGYTGGRYTGPRWTVSPSASDCRPSRYSGMKVHVLTQAIQRLCAFRTLSLRDDGGAVRMAKRTIGYANQFLQLLDSECHLDRLERQAEDGLG